MTKPTKWYVRPAKTQISQGIFPAWSEYSLSASRKLGSLATHWTQAKTDRWAHIHFVGLVTKLLKYCLVFADWLVGTTAVAIFRNKFTRRQLWIKGLKHLDVVVSFAIAFAMAYKVENSCNCLFNFLHTKFLLKQESTLKGKNSLPLVLSI